MIKSRLKAKNCNRGQLFWPCWVSSARCSEWWSNQLIDWSSIPGQPRFQDFVLGTRLIPGACPYPLNADGDDLRWNSNPNLCRLANATCKTRDKGQKRKSRISCRCRDKETVDRQKPFRRKIMTKPCLKWVAYRIWKENAWAVGLFRSDKIQNRLMDKVQNLRKEIR